LNNDPAHVQQEGKIEGQMTKDNETAMLIVFEGGDAAGKNEMSSRLAAHVQHNLGKPVLHMTFPRYKTPLGQAILRHLQQQIKVIAFDKESFAIVPAPEDALVFQCMMVADKAHAASEIEDALDQGITVICDRYWQSAYAFGKSDGLDEEWLFQVHDMLPQADLNIFLDLDPKEAAKRRPGFRDRYEEDRNAQDRVRENYQKLWRSMQAMSVTNLPSWPIVDASKTVQAVFEEVKRCYDEARTRFTKH
jgi:dTMP kinase